MMSKLAANIAVNLIFFKRNRLLFSLLIFMVVIFGIAAVTTMNWLSATEYFNIIKSAYSGLSMASFLITLAVSLLIVHYHVSGRSLKMVFTKPCPPEVWMGSVYISVFITATALYAMTFVVCMIMFAALGVPAQPGVFYMALIDLAITVIWASYIIFLSTLMHPFLVLLAVLFFNENTLYWLKIMGRKSGFAASFLGGLGDALYFLVPMFSPYGEDFAPLFKSMRAADADTGFIAMTFLYTASLAAFCYVLSVIFIKRKNLS